MLAKNNERSSDVLNGLQDDWMSNELGTPYPQ